MGVTLALLSCCFNTAKDLVSKRLAAQLDGTVSTFASFAFALPFYLVVLAVLLLTGHERLDYSLTFFWLVLARSVTDTFAEAMKMYALAYGDISVVAAFFSLSPLVLVVIFPFITGETLTWIGALGVCLVAAGSLVMVYRPSTKDWGAQQKAIGLALLASLFFALNSCFDHLAIHQGMEEQQPTTPVFAGFAMTLLSAVFLLPLILVRPDRQAALWTYRRNCILRGFLETSFMVAKLTAIVFLKAPYVVGIQRVSLVLSIIAGRLYFQEEDFGKRLVAGLLILTGVLLIVLGADPAGQ